MSYDVRFQLIDRRAVSLVLRALVQNTAPPASAFDRREDAGALWAQVQAAGASGDPAQAARAACWLAVSWSAASLPAVSLRNVALTHRPLRMPDAYNGLDLGGIGSPQVLFELAVGLDSPVLAQLPRRLDSGAWTGAYIDSPERAGADLASFVRTLAAADRRPLAPLVALLRAAERAGLAVWESIDAGPVVPDDPRSRATLRWPGLAHPALEGPLSEAEWAQLDGTWHRETLGDLDDLVTLVGWVDPADRARVPYAQRALQQAFVPRREASGNTPFVDDILPRALEWLEATLATPEFVIESARAHARLMDCFQNRSNRSPLPPHVLQRVAAAPVPANISPETLAAELAAMIQQHERSDAMAPEIARGIAERWHALYLAAPERARPRALSGNVFRDTTALGLLLQRLDGPPSAPLVALVVGLFDKACDDDDRATLFNTAARARAEWLRALARGARELGLSRDADQLERAVNDRQRDDVAALLTSGPKSEAEAERIAERWHALFLAAPAVAYSDDLTEWSDLDDPLPCARLLRRLAGPPSRELGSMVLGLFKKVEDYDEERGSPLAREVIARRAWLGELVAGLRALGHESDASELARRVDAYEARERG